MVTMNRKDFFRKVCASGVCMCGFGSIALSDNKKESYGTGMEDQDNALIHSWIAVLLSNINKGLSEEEKKNILKNCSVTHFEDLKMDETLSPYIGDLDKFIIFLKDQLLPAHRLRQLLYHQF